MSVSDTAKFFVGATHASPANGGSADRARHTSPLQKYDAPGTTIAFTTFVMQKARFGRRNGSDSAGVATHDAQHLRHRV